MKKRVFVIGSCTMILVGSLQARPKILDRSVIGRWTFDDGAQSADVSGYGGGAISIGSNASIVSAGGYDGGYLNFSTAGATVTATLGNDAPAFNGQNGKNSSKNYTFAARFRSGNASMVSAYYLRNASYLSAFNDTANWHSLLYRYDGGFMGAYTQHIVGDPQYNDNFAQAWNTAGGDSEFNIAKDDLNFLVQVSGKTVTIGGSVESMAYKGGLDDVLIINRMLSNREMTRYRFTGETYIYPWGGLSGVAEFDGGRYWSSQLKNPDSDTSYTAPAPGDVFGAAYLIENRRTMTCDHTATFGKDVANKISLTIGRLGKVNYSFADVNGEIQPEGYFKSTGDGTEITFYDLRLNYGQINEDGDNQTIRTTLLDVAASSEHPLEFYVYDNRTCIFDAGGQVTGDGYISKAGNGTLILKNYIGSTDPDCPGNPKVHLNAGYLKTNVLNSYWKGTLLVDAESGPVDIAMEESRFYTKLIPVKFETKLVQPGKHAILKVPGYMGLNNISLSYEKDAKLNAEITLEDGVVYLTAKSVVAEIPAEDKGSYPVLIGF